MLKPGYVFCSCRDCPQILEGNENDLLGLVFCAACEQYNCEEQFHLGMTQECRVPNAYGQDFDND
jgi:hypothetical protein